MKLLSWPNIAILTLVMTLIAHFTRFENTISVSFSAGKVTVGVHGNSLELDVSPEAIISIGMQLSRTMVANSSLSAVRIEAAGELLKNEDAIVGYLFGRSFLGNFSEPSWPSFQPTFGDWSMDRTMSEPFIIFDKPLLQPLSFTAKILGRGSVSLEFLSEKSQKITINLHDGFIDNCFSLCVADNCVSTNTQENALTNTLRIGNFFSEGFILALAYCIILKIFGARKDLRETVKVNSRIACETVCGISGYHIALGTLVLIHFLSCAFVSKTIFGSTPHIPDSASYYKQAVVLSTGSLLTEIPPAKPYQSFLSNSSKLRNNRIEYIHSNHLWPALLALGIKLGIADLMAPLLSSLSVFFIFWIVTRLYSEQEALLAATLYSVSPFVLVMSGDYMLHIPTQTAVLGSMVLGTMAWERKSLCLALFSGLLWSYAFSLRQATACAFLLPALFLIYLHAPKVLVSRTLIAFCVGILPIFITTIFDNWWVTGKWFALPHSALYGKSIKLANFAFGANQGDAMLGYLPSIFFSIPFPQIIFGLVFFPFVASCNKHSYFLLSIFLLLLGIHLFFDDTGLHAFGPRFLFESMWALYALIAVSITFSVRYLGKSGRMILIACFLVGFFWNLYGLKNILPLYNNYNGISSRVVQKLREYEASKVLFLMNYGGWQNMDIGATILDPSFKEAIMISLGEDRGDLNILDAFPNRKIILVNLNSIREISREELASLDLTIAHKY